MTSRHNPMHTPTPGTASGQQTLQQEAISTTSTTRRKATPLTASEKRALLRCCLQCQIAYKRGNKKKYWNCVSLQFERVANRAFTAVSCERAITKLINERRRRRRKNSMKHFLTSSGVAGKEEEEDTDDTELDVLVDQLMQVRDEFEAGGEKGKMCNMPVVPILDRVANDLCEMEPGISRRLEAVERSVLEVRQIRESQVKSMEDVLAAMGEILTEL